MPRSELAIVCKSLYIGVFRLSIDRSSTIAAFSIKASCEFVFAQHRRRALHGRSPSCFSGEGITSALLIQAQRASVLRRQAIGPRNEIANRDGKVRARAVRSVLDEVKNEHV